MTDFCEIVNPYSIDYTQDLWNKLLLSMTKTLYFGTMKVFRFFLIKIIKHFKNNLPPIILYLCSSKIARVIYELTEFLLEIYDFLRETKNIDASNLCEVGAQFYQTLLLSYVKTFG